MLQHHVIVDGKVSGCLVGHVHVVSLMHQSDECSSHRDYVIVRVRGEDQHLLRERCGFHRPCRVVCVRLSSRPAGNRVLELVEHVDVDLVKRPVEIDEIAEEVLQIVLLRELENRLVNLLAEPHHGFPDQFRSPFARTDLPRGHRSCQKGGGHLVCEEGDVVVALEP